MTKILVIHQDASTRVFLESLAERNHQVSSAKNLKTGIKIIPEIRPDLIVAGYDTKSEEAARLLRHLKLNAARTPVVVLLSRGSEMFQQALVKMGAKGFLEQPIDQDRFDQVIAAALKADEEARSGPPPLTEEELNGNLSLLERRLNQQMKCVIGKNQVFIHSRVLGGSTTRPRVVLRCPLRPDYGLQRDVYYEFIRDVCCRDPNQCEAMEQFQAARETA